MPGLAGLESIGLTSTDGGSVPLSAIDRVKQRRTALNVNYLDQFPSATFSSNVADGYSLDNAVKAVSAAEAQLGMPSELMTQFQGAILAFEATLTSTVRLLVVAIVAVYIVLRILYESYVHPLTILSMLPSAGVGACVAGHWQRDYGAGRASNGDEDRAARAVYYVGDDLCHAVGSDWPTGRPGAWERAGGVRQLALDLPDQYSRRHRRCHRYPYANAELLDVDASLRFYWFFAAGRRDGDPDDGT